ncbi:MAG: hypothetical protein KC731_34715 [Myxococcales bacterium]|nr:hypothetical protein [Myxococcales bacterium]
MQRFDGRVTLGETGLVTSRMGIGADSGVPAAAVEWAFERGVNYLYWGTTRTVGMQGAIRHLAPRHRDELVIALQSYDTTGLLLRTTFERGLRQLRLDHADVLILGKRDAPLSRRVIDAALALKEDGLVRCLCVSAHDRSTYASHLALGIFDLVMVRYNCAHPGAEKEVFPLLSTTQPRPGVIVYNSTRWGHLFDPAWMPAGERTPEPIDLYRHALTHPAVDMVLTAPKTATQLRDNLRALAAEPLSAEEQAWLQRIGEHVHQLSPNSNWDFLRSSRGPR